MGHLTTLTNLVRHMEVSKISTQFILRSVYDVLPTLTNLHKWRPTETPDCTLRRARGTLHHVLSSCAIALSQGRYTWRHNNVLR